MYCGSHPMDVFVGDNISDSEMIIQLIRTVQSSF